MGGLGLVDILNGHAGARFRWFDARTNPEKNPVEWAAAVVTVDQLQTGLRPTVETTEEVVVFADDESSTNAAAAALSQMGYEDVIPIPRGYAWVEKYMLSS
jgi:hypothetical protein